MHLVLIRFTAGLGVDRKRRNGTQRRGRALQKRRQKGKKDLSAKEKGGLGACPPEKCRCCLTGAQRAALPQGKKNYSNFSVMTGNCSLALAKDFTTMASALSAVVLREVAISLTRRYFARSSIFFSRKERGLLRLRETRLLRTTATSRRDPVRMRSEFSLKRCFQSW